MEYYYVLPIVISVIYTQSVLFSRQKAWVKSRLNWILTIISFFSAFIIYFIIDATHENKGIMAGLITPLVFLLINTLFTGISFIIQGRNLNLWSRYAIGKKKFSLADKIISTFLIFIAGFLPIVILLITNKLL